MNAYYATVIAPRMAARRARRRDLALVIDPRDYERTRAVRTHTGPIDITRTPLAPVDYVAYLRALARKDAGVWEHFHSKETGLAVDLDENEDEPEPATLADIAASLPRLDDIKDRLHTDIPIRSVAVKVGEVRCSG